MIIKVYLLALGTILYSISHAQITLVPDTNFEQTLVNLGFDAGPLDGAVPTASIDTLTYLNVGSSNITDLTGLEDFISLAWFSCDFNPISIKRFRLN